MILKLRVNGMFNRQAWELIGNISSARYSPLTKEGKKEIDGNSDAKLLNDYIERLDENGVVYKDIPIDDYKMITVWFRHKAGKDEPMNIVTNMPAYLLNDEGKTLEKI